MATAIVFAPQASATAHDLRLTNEARRHRCRLQALCYKCNANKGARDDTDPRCPRDQLGAKEPGCAFTSAAKWC